MFFVFNVVYLVEIVIKVVGMGFKDNKYSFMNSLLNRLDFYSCLCFLLGLKWGSLQHLEVVKLYRLTQLLCEYVHFRNLELLL